ncbi:SpoIIE family protein phosphatase [Streptomyces sp. NPDC050743]|uniref:ATP-binding SpoIIE family protein phosphatase n=1 Tax=Streptomyces sp. NPDC050743 TaxID=3365634 RepID=UPI003796C418
MRPIQSSRSFAVLLLSVALISGLELALAAADVQVMGIPEYSVLISVVASALLPLRHTMIVGLFNLVAAIVVYGIFLQRIGKVNQITVIAALAVAVGISWAVCRVRIAREGRFRHLVIARERLALLSEASSRVGSTLNVARTAEELTEVAVHRFADHATVDLCDRVLDGEEPVLGPHMGEITLRRIARQSGPAVLPGTVRPAETVTYRPGSVPALSLRAGQPMRVEIADTADADCWPAGPSDAGMNAPHSALAVPLRARGVTLGAALFTRSRSRDPFDADDLLLAQEIGARAAVCVDNARRYTHEHNTYLALQRSLLPPMTPKQSAVEAATRYLPADSRAGVGGDWYDVIPLSGARVALVVGDVVGHGIHALATMGRLRSAVRTLADIDLPPDELLTHLDDLAIQRRMIRDQAQEAGRDTGADYGEVGAACLYMIYDPVSRRCTAARAGHLPPAVVRPGPDVDFLDIPAGPPLGVGGLPFEAAELQLPKDSLLVLYTDGLIESPGHTLDEGLERLRKALSGPTPSLEDMCDHVLNMVADDRSEDDAALVIARIQELDSRHVATWDVSEDLSEVAHVRDLATSQLADWDLEESAFTTELIVSELVTNAIRYGKGPVRLRLIRQDTLTCEVSDGSNTAPHLRRARMFDEGGRGLLIVAQLAERWGTRQRLDGKTIWAELRLQEPPVK